jgi:aminobenzoyl-glutamate utilization protein B
MSGRSPVSTMVPFLIVSVLVAVPSVEAAAKPPAQNRRLDAWKTEATAEVERNAKLAQEIVDTVFSFGELGFQETETSRYLKEILVKNGFAVEDGIAGIPTAWMATWGSGKPVIALGSDIDGIPQASQKPGVAYHAPLIEGAPGHGEGHNSGQAVNILAAIAVKRIMTREKLPGTLKLWPGVAEELVGTKAYYVRAGYFKDVDACLFTHVGDNLSTTWGASAINNGLISVEFTFRGQSAHSAGRPWMGRSALDAVELMNAGWNYKREHLRTQQRSHYVITSGGDQPNVVPPVASVWYYFRETTYDRIQELFETAKKIAEGASLMTGTKVESIRILGSAWPGYFNKPIAEAATANAQKVGLPQWSSEDQALAKAVQTEVGVKEAKGLAVELEKLKEHVKEEDRRGGGSDDIGDISWNVPTIVLRYPSNIPELPGHNWANGITMATPIAHKGVVAGGKALAMTLLDLLARPDLVKEAWTFFKDVQSKEGKYQPLVRPEDTPAIELNRAVMEKYRPEMRKYYYDPARYPTYLEQLGIKYPTIRTPETPQP